MPAATLQNLRDKFGYDPKTGRFTSKAGVSLSYKGPSNVKSSVAGMPTGYKTYHPHKKDMTQTLSPDDVMRRHFKDPATYNDLHRVADSFVNAYHAQAAREFTSRGYNIHQPLQPAHPKDKSNPNLFIEQNGKIRMAARINGSRNLEDHKVSRPGSPLHSRFQRDFLVNASSNGSHNVSLHDSKSNSARYKAMHKRVLEVLINTHKIKMTPEEQEAHRAQQRRNSWIAYQDYQNRNAARWARQSRSSARRENH